VGQELEQLASVGLVHTEWTDSLVRSLVVLHILPECLLVVGKLVAQLLWLELRILAAEQMGYCILVRVLVRHIQEVLVPVGYTLEQLFLELVLFVEDRSLELLVVQEQVEVELLQELVVYMSLWLEH
jgi:hypothetical protein